VESGPKDTVDGIHEKSVVFEEAENEQVDHQGEQHVALSRTSVTFAFCDLQGHEVIEEGTVDHKEYVNRLAPAVENQTGHQQDQVPDIQKPFRCDVVCRQNYWQEIEYEDDAAK